MKKTTTLFTKKIIAALVFAGVLLSADSVNAQVTVSGSSGQDGNYTSLTNASGAFAALNGANQAGMAITITITADVTTEAGTNALTGAGGMWTSLTVVPSGNRTLSGTMANNPLFDISGADFVTIDGLNTGGNSLTLSNLSTSALTRTSTVRFIGDATNNTVTNCTVLGSATMSLGTNGGVIFISTSTTVGNDNITISNCKIGPAGATLPSKGIYANGSTTSYMRANSNVTIDNCEIYDFFLAGGCAGIYALTGNTEWNITNNKIYQTGARAMTGTMSAIYFSEPNYGNNMQITDNTIGYSGNARTGTFTLTNTGSFQGIYFNANPAAANTCNINNNAISDFSFTSATGTFNGIINNTSSSSNTININFDTIRNISALTTTGAIYGISAGGATALSVCNNTITNISRTASGVLYGIGLGAGTNCTVSDNNISALAINNAASASSLYAIHTSGAAVNITANGNTISNVSSASTAGITIRGISDETSGAGNKIYQNNIINNFSAAGGATINGIYISTSSTPNPAVISGNIINTFSDCRYAYGIQQASAGAADIYKNKIYDLSSANASAIVDGIYITAGTTNNIFNNIIGDLRTTAVSATIPLTGIYINAGSNANVYYNTIYLNATSSGATFGSASIYANTSVTLDMRNNILVNTSTPKGATGFTCAYRRSSTTLTSYAATSNNNLFYAGTPGANNLIMYDGTNSYQTLAAFQGAVAPSDALSVTEDPVFLSTTGGDAGFLHIDPSFPTQIESGAANISTYSDDYDGDIRHGNPGYSGSGTAPDIGADECEVAPDIIITYSVLQNTVNTTAPSLTATITAPAGVNTTTGTAPRLYYKRETDNNAWIDNTNTTNGWKWVECTTPVGDDFTFTMDFSLIYDVVSDPVDAGDFIQYFVTAQDLSPTPKVAVNSGTAGSGTPASVDDYASLFGGAGMGGSVNKYWVLPSQGTYTVGSGGQPIYNYSNFTPDYGFFAGMNDPNTVISGNITINVVNNINTEDGANALNQWVESGGGGYSLTVQSGDFMNKDISGNYNGTAAGNNGLFRMNGADRVNFNGGTALERKLTIRNNNTGTWAAVFSFVNDASDNTLNSCIFEGSSTSASNGVIYFGASGGASPAGNDNNNISFCDIKDAGGNLPANGIYSQGTNTAGLENSGNIVSYCKIYNFFNPVLTGCGVRLAGNTLSNTGWTISDNSFYQTGARNFTSTGFDLRGISIEHSAANGFTVSNNFIGGSAPNCGGTPWIQTGNAGINHNFVGIRLSVANADPASNVDGNQVANINCNAQALVTANSGITVSQGKVNIGVNAGNTIGSVTGTGYIIFESASGTFNGIFAGSGNTTSLRIENNFIGGISLPGASNYTNFKGIAVNYNAPSSLTISGNIIGSNIVANSIDNSGSGASKTYGIQLTLGNSTSYTISNNIINNLTVSTSNSGAQLIGIAVGGSNSGSFNISGNVIKNLNSASANSGSGANAAITGIINTSLTEGQSVTSNRIFSLSSSAPTQAVVITGVYYAGPASGTNIINKNFIHSFSLASVSASAQFNGIVAAAGLASYSNNMIRLGINSSGASITLTPVITGIIKDCSEDLDFYFNSVYIGGNGVGAGTAGTYSFRRTTTGNDSLRNNIFVNERSNATTGGVHYSVFLNEANSYGGDNNIFYAPNSGGMLFGIGLADYNLLSDWNTATGGQDMNSLVVDPLFINPATATPNLHIAPNSPADAVGIATAGVSDDFDGEVRSTLTPVDIGADAMIACPLPVSYNLTGGGSYCSGSTGVITGLDGSETAVNYQLLYEGNPVWSPVTGDGNPISFGIQTQAGAYTVEATSPAGCKTFMSGSANISIYNCITSLPSLAINTTGAKADTSAMLDISDTLSGILLPQFSNAGRDLINSPDTGLLIYNTSTNKINCYNSNGWNEISSGFIITPIPGSAVSYGTSVNNTGASATHSAILDVSSTAKGVLIPRTMPGAVYGAARGSIIYNIFTGKINYFNGSTWIELNTSTVSATTGGGAQTPDGCAVNITNAAPAPSAVLDVSAQNKALLIPRLTSSQRSSIQPATGLIIYNKNTDVIEYFNGTSWYGLQ